MAKEQRTHYETLGVKPNVKHHELTFLYDRLMSARKREDAPPDQKADTALRNAFDVLSDPDRREAYDRELALARLKPPSGRRNQVIAVAFVVLVGAGVGWYAMKRGTPEPLAHARPVEQVKEEANLAVARLQSTDMSGATKPAGLAFAIDNGVMVASCDHITANVQLTVNLTPRVAAARLTQADEQLGLCRLEVKGAGSWPLRVAAKEVRAGEIVYATQVNAVGEVSLNEGRVKAVLEAKGGREVQTTLDKSVSGAPLLNVEGQVVAVTSHSRHVVLPRAWVEAPGAGNNITYSPPASDSSASEAATPSADPAAPSPYDRGGSDPTDSRRNVLPKNSPISQEHAERLHKQYRPERKIPANQDP